MYVCACLCCIHIFVSLLCIYIYMYIYMFKSGVVQGSCIGPLLFVHYVNDVENFSQIALLLIANDLKLYTELELNGNHAALHKELDLLNAWCIK